MVAPRKSTRGRRRAIRIKSPISISNVKEKWRFWLSQKFPLTHFVRFQPLVVLFLTIGRESLLITIPDAVFSVVVISADELLLWTKADYCFSPCLFMTSANLGKEERMPFALKDNVALCSSLKDSNKF